MSADLDPGFLAAREGLGVRLPAARGRSHRDMAREYWVRLKALLSAVDVLSPRVDYARVNANHMAADVVTGLSVLFSLPRHAVPQGAVNVLLAAVRERREGMRASPLRELLTAKSDLMRGAVSPDDARVWPVLLVLDLLETIRADRAEGRYGDELARLLGGGGDDSENEPAGSEVEAAASDGP